MKVKDLEYSDTGLNFQVFKLGLTIKILKKMEKETWFIENTHTAMGFKITTNNEVIDLKNVEFEGIHHGDGYLYTLEMCYLKPFIDSMIKHQIDFEVKF